MLGRFDRGSFDRMPLLQEAYRIRGSAKNNLPDTVTHVNTHAPDSLKSYEILIVVLKGRIRQVLIKSLVEYWSNVEG
jgi:hypothetical protein